MFDLSRRSYEKSVVPTCPASDEAAPTLNQIDQLVRKRLEIARLGLTEARRHVRAGLEDDAEVILSKIDEDLCLLQRRVRCEIEKVQPDAPSTMMVDALLSERRLPRLPR